jgi:hypothetical protein
LEDRRAGFAFDTETEEGSLLYDHGIGFTFPDTTFELLKVVVSED